MILREKIDWKLFALVGSGSEALRQDTKIFSQNHSVPVFTGLGNTLYIEILVTIIAR